MARNPRLPGVLPEKTHTAAELVSAIDRLKRRVLELQNFKVSEVHEWEPANLKALEVAILDTVEKVFGQGTVKGARYGAAADLTYSESVWSLDYDGPQTPISEVRQTIGRSITTSVALLSQAIRSLEEDLSYISSASFNVAAPPDVKALSKKVFVVHGHDEAAKEKVARFLTKVGFDPIVLHEQANAGQTIIEKFERHGSVGFAVVLLTPDDIGAAQGGEMQPRARQNVILELGYFMGRLGRKHVCALKSGSLEVPSDFAGVVYEQMDAGGAWQTALARELQEAGYEIDWNTVMRR